MQDGFNLLKQKKYLEKTNFTEWTARFTNILDVEIFKSEKFDKRTRDTAFVKFGTKIGWTAKLNGIITRGHGRLFKKMGFIKC